MTTTPTTSEASVDPVEILDGQIVSSLLSRLRTAGAGHCMRVDDIDASRARRLAVRLREGLTESSLSVDVHVLTGAGAVEGDLWSVGPDRAIELRNRKRRPLLLLVPEGEGAAASSLDNSFERVPLIDLIHCAGEVLERQLQATSVGPAILGLRRQIGRRRFGEAWTELLASLTPDPSEERLGRELWRIGLVPDYGTDLTERLERNVSAVAAIARSRRSTASVADRLVNAGVREGEVRMRLEMFLSGEAGVLTDSRSWTRVIGERHSGVLTFETWPSLSEATQHIDSVEVTAFRDDKGRIDTKCKLQAGSDGQLLCPVTVETPGTVVLRWSTAPVRVEAVAHWALDVVPPEDCRVPDTEPLTSSRVRGDKRRATLRVPYDESALAEGTRYVVRVRGFDHSGEQIYLADGQRAESDSQEFEVSTAEASKPSTRTASALSLPEAMLAAAAAGVANRHEEMPTWDLPGQVFGLRISSRRTVKLPVSEVLIGAQRRTWAAATSGLCFTASARPGELLSAADLVEAPLRLPAALSMHRAAFLTALAARHPRDTGESAAWDSELAALMSQYVAAYRRALDVASSDTLGALLRQDTLTVRTPTDTVRGTAVGVVILPTHPLRLRWLSTHDSLLRDWAGALDEISPRTARAHSVDLGLVRRVEPVNYPFVLPGPDGGLFVHAQELTHGSGLYVETQSADTAVDVEALCRALGVKRRGAGADATVGLVRERLSAYRSAHPGGPSLRVLGLNPGEGDLLAEALDPGDDSGADIEEPGRLEVLAYSDEVSYVNPAGALHALQRSLRSRSRASQSSHLSPPLALSVRPRAQLVDDGAGSHVAVAQDVAASHCKLLPSSAITERSASFHDLLTTTATTPSHGDGVLIWNTAPALASRGSRTGGLDLAGLHRSHQRAVARLAGLPDTFPVVGVTLDETRLAELRTLHRRADWVVTLDRYLGLDLFDGSAAEQLGESFILDYAPDFVDGLAHRVTVTTSQRQEVERFIGAAMRRMGLVEVRQSVRNVLDTLALVSGRLALRLLGENTLATEAVSLAALVRYLQLREAKTDLIVIPVDAHPEIFGVHSRPGNEPARRCDLLLVKVGQRSFTIECVEVKARREAELPGVLADRIVDQLQDTEQVLTSRFFAVDPPRVDQDLQRARLCGLLHHYADRSHQHGVIGLDRIGDIHRWIDRIEEHRENAKVTLRGYVISVTGEHGFPAKHRGVPISVITGRELDELGFTTATAPTTTQLAVSVPETTSADGRPMNPPVAPDSNNAVPQHEALTSGNSAALQEPTAPVEFEAEGPSNTMTLATPDASTPDAERSAPTEMEVTLGVDDLGRDAVWRLSTKGSPHAFIVGIPGQGKSVTTRRIIRELARQGLPSLVLDCHGDMTGDPAGQASVIDAARGLPFSPFEFDHRHGRPVNAAAWEITEIVAYVCKLGDIQRNNVYKGLLAAYEECGWADGARGERLPTIGEFAQAVARAEERSRGRHARDRIRPLTDFGLFHEQSGDGFNPLSPEGTVIDVSGLGLEEVQLAASAFLLRKVYREMFRWEQTDRLRLAVVLDEAHRMARDITLPKIMKEGRKYGIAVIVASQHVDDFHRDVLGNAGMKIVFRTNYPSSKPVSGFLRGRDHQDLSQRIEQLDVACAYVSTPDDVRARRVSMSR